MPADTSTKRSRASVSFKCHEGESLGVASLKGAWLCRIASAEERLAASETSSKQEVERLQAELDKCASDRPTLRHMHLLLSILHGSQSALHISQKLHASSSSPNDGHVQADQSGLQVQALEQRRILLRS